MFQIGSLYWKLPKSNGTIISLKTVPNECLHIPQRGQMQRLYTAHHWHDRNAAVSNKIRGAFAMRVNTNIIIINNDVDDEMMIIIQNRTLSYY